MYSENFDLVMLDYWVDLSDLIGGFIELERCLGNWNFMLD